MNASRRPRLLRGPTNAAAVALAIGILAVGCSGTPPSALPTSPVDAPTASPASALPAGTLDEVQAARGELDKLVDAMEQKHPDLFDGLSEAEWRSAVDALDAQIPGLLPDAPEQLMVEVTRLAMLPGLRAGRHGHMVVFPPGSSSLPLLGLATYVFADGVYVTAGLPPHEDLAGARITAVADVPIDEVRALIDPLLPRDNDWTPEMHLPSHLVRPEVLVGLGITATVGPTEFTVEMPDGTQRTVKVGLVPRGDLDPFRIFTTFKLPERPSVEWTSRASEPFWWTTLHNGGTIFAQQNVVQSVPESVLEELRTAAADARVRRVVLDLRHNVGGDYSSLLTTLQDPAIDQPDRLFVITSTNTFSGASALVTELDLGTEALIIGEPMGGAPNFFTFGSTVYLDRLPIPLEVPIATGMEENEPTAGRLTIEPQIPVPLTAADYFNGRDSALEAIRSYGRR